MSTNTLNAPHERDGVADGRYRCTCGFVTSALGSIAVRAGEMSNHLEAPDQDDLLDLARDHLARAVRYRESDPDRALNCTSLAMYQLQNLDEQQKRYEVRVAERARAAEYHTVSYFYCPTDWSPSWRRPTEWRVQCPCGYRDDVIDEVSAQARVERHVHEALIGKVPTPAAEVTL